MEIKLSKNNPFYYDRYAFAFENIKEGFNCLDYGCYDGAFMYNVIQNKDNIKYIGLDKNKDIVKYNPHNQNIKLFKNSIPFDDSSFDLVTILDVIEHIHDQSKVLAEINRVLNKNGVLIITSPKKNIFSFLDIGNLKFIFPRIHKMWYIAIHSNLDYEYKYLNNPSGLIGDIEKEKKWHQHFSQEDMNTLLESNGFHVETFDGSSLFQRLFILFDVCKIGFIIPKKLKLLDARLFKNSNLFCKAIKK